MRTGALIRARWLRLSSAALVSILGCAGVVALSLHTTPPPANLSLRTGTAWVTSNVVGELALLDGVTGELGARVQVAEPAAILMVRQQGADAYVINSVDGKATRIDGKTLKALAPVSVLPDLLGADTVAGGVSALYALDSRNGRLVGARARTMTVTGAMVTVPTTAKLTDTPDGLVWLLDPTTGVLHRYGAAAGSGPYRERSSGATDVVDVAGSPVLLDRVTGRASLVDKRTGDTTDGLDAELSGDDIASGAQDSPHLLVVRPRRGAVAYCRFGESSCRSDIFLTNGADALGPAVEVSDHILVPDYTQGMVHIVDMAKNAVVGQAHLFDESRRPAHFDLLVRDGIAFFNDPASERAGVIHLDGTVRQITKYDPVSPMPTALPSRQPTGKPTPSRSPRPATGPSGKSTRTTIPKRTTTGAPESGSAPPGGGLSVIRLDVSPSIPEVDTPVSISAVTAGVTPTAWRWTVTKPDGSVLTTNTTARFTVAFGVVGSYSITVVASRGTVAATRTETLPVVAAAPPVRCGDTVTGAVELKTDLTCPSDGLIVGADDTIIDLGGHTIRGPGTSGNAGIADVDFNHHDVTIRNGTVINFGVNVYLNDQVATVNNMKLSGYAGRYRGDFSGDLVLLGSGAIVQGGVIGSIFGGSESLISGVALDSAGTVSSGGDSTIEDCTFARGGGFSVSQGDRWTLDHNVFTDASITLFQSRNDIFKNNTLTRTSMLVQAEDEGLQVIDNTFTGGGITAPSRKGATIGGEFTGDKITGNSFTGSPSAGIYIDINKGDSSANMTISRNTFANDGHDNGGLTDSQGSAVNDGLHLTLVPGIGITVADNRASGDADHGIEITPGTVVDGGGNVSTDPQPCVGVTCG